MQDQHQGNEFRIAAYPDARSGSTKYWTEEDWSRAVSNADWVTMVKIFKDRIQYRFLEQIEAIEKWSYSGFAMMALDCLLLETLAQFYAGLNSSDDARRLNGDKMPNWEFYQQFLLDKSFVLKNTFSGPDAKEKARLFYQTIRCGILHQAETKGSSLIQIVNKRDRTVALELLPDRKGLIIYRQRFHELVVEEFVAYCDCLTNNSLVNYRGNFIQKMGYVSHSSGGSK